MGKPRPRFNFDASVPQPAASSPTAALEATLERNQLKAADSTRVSARPTSREGKKGVTFYLPPGAWRQLKVLSAQRDRSVQDLMLDATDLLFAEHGQHRLARE